MTLKGSLDGGLTWCYRQVLDAEQGGYVELAADPWRGRLYVLYEELGGTALHFVTVDSGELTV